MQVQRWPHLEDDKLAGRAIAVHKLANGRQSSGSSHLIRASREKERSRSTSTSQGQKMAARRKQAGCWERTRQPIRRAIGMTMSKDGARPSLLIIGACLIAALVPGEAEAFAAVGAGRGGCSPLAGVLAGRIRGLVGNPGSFCGSQRCFQGPALLPTPAPGRSSGGGSFSTGLMMKKKAGRNPQIAENREARFNYEVGRVPPGPSLTIQLRCPKSAPSVA
jgi:hypothetical protein